MIFIYSIYFYETHINLIYTFFLSNYYLFHLKYTNIFFTGISFTPCSFYREDDRNCLVMLNYLQSIIEALVVLLYTSQAIKTLLYQWWYAKLASLRRFITRVTTLNHCSKALMGHFSGQTILRHASWLVLTQTCITLRLVQKAH